MKIKTSLLLALLAASSLAAAPLSKTTAVHAKPNASSAAIAVLNAGAEPVLATSGEPAPSGWTAIELAGPHEVYVQSKDIMKSLDVRPGASFYTAPKIDSAVLTTMSKGDSAEISGLHGRWTQIKLQKKVIGYIGDDTVDSPIARPAVANSNLSSGFNAPVTPAPRSGGASGPSSPVAASPVQVYSGPAQSTPAPAGAASTLSPAAAAALPRMFEGTFVPAKRFLAYKPYDYQLNDRVGERYAFLDVSRLSKADPVDKYMNRVVTVYGTAKAIENTKDIVIEVDSIQIH
ncbi:MAG: SH3 domain-containing protein [Nibricoccus sp.]